MRERVEEMNLSAFIYKGELDVVICFGLGGDLCGDPAELLVRKPNSGALAVYVFGHVRRAGGRAGGRRGRVVTSRQLVMPRPLPNPSHYAHFPVTRL